MFVTAAFGGRGGASIGLDEDFAFGGRGGGSSNGFDDAFGGICGASDGLGEAFDFIGSEGAPLNVFGGEIDLTGIFGGMF